MSMICHELRNLLEILSTEPNQERLSNCIAQFVKYVQQKQTKSYLSQPQTWWFDKVISIAQFLMIVLEKIASIEFITSIFTAVLNITSKFLRRDIFIELVEHNLFLDLQKAVNTLNRSLSYLIGVYNDIKAKQLSERKQIASEMAHNFNIHTGVNEIEHLMADIKGIVSSQYLTDSMMKRVECYCFVSLMMELNYLLAIELKEKCNESSSGYSVNLEMRKNLDKNLLGFLYKPNTETLKLFLKYTFEKKWPLVNTFLQSRGLLVDNFAKLDIDERVFQIVNADDQGIRLSLHDCFVFFCMRANRTTDGRKTHFQIECQNNGEVHFRCSQYDRYLVSKHAWTRADKDTPGSNGVNVDWFLVKIGRQKSTEGDPECFVIVAKSTETNCIYYDKTGRVHDKAYDTSDDRCFWTLKPVEKSMVQRF